MPSGKHRLHSGVFRKASETLFHFRSLPGRYGNCRSECRHHTKFFLSLLYPCYLKSAAKSLCFCQTIWENHAQCCLVKRTFHQTKFSKLKWQRIMFILDPVINLLEERQKRMEIIIRFCHISCLFILHAMQRKC